MLLAQIFLLPLDHRLQTSGTDLGIDGVLGLSRRVGAGVFTTVGTSELTGTPDTTFQRERELHSFSILSASSGLSADDEASHGP